jgi:internalin A
MLDWVQDKIRRARAEGWTRLDLGNAGVTAIPEEVWELEWLEVLVLSRGYYDHQRRTWIGSENQGPENTIVIIPEQMGRFSCLRELYLNENKIIDVKPLAALTSLTALDLGGTQVRDLVPVAALINLTTLYLSGTQVQDLGPLAALTNLTTLHLGVFEVQYIEPLTNHSVSVHGFDNGTQVEDVESLAVLTNLTAIDLSRTQMRTFPQFLLALPVLRTLSLYGTPLHDVPSEILGTCPGADCLNAVRAHFADKAQGVALDREMKLILLGNGGVGKSSVTKRLVHDTFDPEEPSTHGIRLEPWTLTVDDGPIDVHIWDFGGQDIYHGTHALFLKSKALFLIVWDRDTEQQPGYSEGGLSFEHYPLQYWLDYVQHTSPDASVLVVENKCDDDCGSGTPVPLTRPSIVFSAREGHGRDVLLANIRDTCQRELANRGAREIGIGRWRVKDTLRRYLADDERRATAERRYRTLSYTDFQALCDAQQGQVTSAHALLEYLHHSGVVFYQYGLFHNQIILDQRWAIDAIYTIFDRQRCYRLLQSKGGRFTRSDLHDLAWAERFSEDEQKLLLSFMESCALCFRISDRDAKDPEYIAPDLLPAPEMVARELTYRRQACGGEGSVWYAYTHAFLHQGVMRRFIVEMGREFRDTALYWKDGVYIDPAPEIQAMAIITCQRRVDNNPARGRITIEVWGRERAQLLTRIRRQLERLTEQADAIAQAIRLDGQPWVDVTKLPDARLLGKVVAQDSTVLEALPLLALLDGAQELHQPEVSDYLSVTVASAPPARPAVYISYAWGDVRATPAGERAMVDRLYDTLVADGYIVKRDTMDLGYKGSISDFMHELGRGGCVVVLISDAYLKSPFCMFELLEIDRNQEFRERICPIILPDARLHTLVDRLTYVEHWQEQFTRIEQLIQRNFRVLSASGSLQEYEKYREITYHADKLVSYLADINSQTPQLLEANDFATLKQAIDARLQSLRPA